MIIIQISSVSYKVFVGILQKFILFNGKLIRIGFFENDFYPMKQQWVQGYIILKFCKFRSNNFYQFLKLFTGFGMIKIE